MSDTDNDWKDIKIINAGYSGYVFIVDDNYDIQIPLQILSANITRQHNVPTFTPFYQKYQFSSTEETLKQIPYSVIRGAKGTYSFNGNINFQLTQGALDYFFRISKNKSNVEKYSPFFNKDSFTIIIYDGLNGIQVKHCIWQSISIQCNPNSLITMSINFQSLNNHKENFQVNKTDYDLDDRFSHALIPYWQSGAENMLSFQLNMERNVTPVYLNNDYLTPTYLRVGLISVNMSANFYEQQKSDSSLSDDSSSKDYQDMTIKIGNKKIIISDMVLQSENFTMSSMQDIGEKTYQWQSIPLEYNVPLFKIEQIKDS